MTLQELIKEKNLTLEDLKKFFIITSYKEEAVVSACEIQGLSRITRLLYEHFNQEISFTDNKSHFVFHGVLEYIYNNQGKENRLIDTMPHMFQIADDINISFSSDEEAMEFYSSCSYKVIGYR